MPAGGKQTPVYFRIVSQASKVLNQNAKLINNDCFYCYFCAVAPKISRPPLSMRVTEGETAMFDCVVMGTRYPATNISWTFEENLIDVRSKV